MPKYAFIELFKYKEKIKKFSQHSEEDILELLYKLLKNVSIFDENVIAPGKIKEAYHLVKDVDEKDIVFVALTLELAGLLWTNDKKLIRGLQEKDFKRFCEFRDGELVPIEASDTAN